MFLRVLQELRKGTQAGALGFRAGFPMERDEKLVLEWEGREKRTTRWWERARPSLAGEGAAGGAPSGHRQANVRAGGAHCPPGSGLSLKEVQGRGKPRGRFGGLGLRGASPAPGETQPRGLGLGARCGAGG